MDIFSVEIIELISSSLIVILEKYYFDFKKIEYNFELINGIIGMN